MSLAVKVPQLRGDDPKADGVRQGTVQGYLATGTYTDAIKAIVVIDATGAFEAWPLAQILAVIPQPSPPAP